MNLPEELDEQAKDAYWLEHDRYRNFSDWVAAAIATKIEQTLETSGLDELPARPEGGLPTGRPLAPRRSSRASDLGA